MTRATALLGLACLVAVCFGTQASAATAVSPGILTTVSPGVVQVRAYSCAGKPVRVGTGFLVGTSVVMTTRRMISGACSVRVAAGRETATGRRFVGWSDERVSQTASDVVTIKLDRIASAAFVFAVSRSSPPIGASLGIAGFGPGGKLGTGQAKLVWKGAKGAVPLIAVRTARIGRPDGSPLVDATGLVVGIVQSSRGTRDVRGQRLAGLSEGIDLARWWGADATTDLCRAYPKGGVVGCSDTTPEPEPETQPEPTPVTQPETEPTPDPPPTPPAPRLPTDYVVKSCWTQFTGDSWANVALAGAVGSIASGDLVAKGPGNYWSVVQLTEGAPADISDVTASLVSPTGFVSPGTPFLWGTDSELAGRGLDWQVSATGAWFFQNDLYPLPQQWSIRWRFPNGQSCSASFTVT